MLTARNAALEKALAEARGHVEQASKCERMRRGTLVLHLIPRQGPILLALIQVVLRF